MPQTNPSDAVPTQPPPTHQKSSERVRPIEYGLVAVIASVIGAMAVPDMTSGVEGMTGLSQATQLQYQLDSYRSVIGNYRADHRVYPGYGYGQPGAWLHGEPSGVNFKRQMLLWSDEWGNVGQMTPGKKELGPYLETGLLKNPVNGLESVLLLRDDQEFPPVPSGETGWYFKPLTGELRANCLGSSPYTGQSYYQL